MKSSSSASPRIATNILHYFGGQAGIAFFNIIISVVLARYMSKETFGTLTYLLALSAVLFPIADLGATGLYLKESARTREEIGHHYVRSVAVKFYGFLLTLPPLWLYLHFFQREFESYFGLICIYVVLQTIYLGTDVFFRAGEFARGWATRKILYEISYFVMTLGTLAILGWTRVLSQFVIAIIATFISLAWATVTIYRATALSWGEIKGELFRPLTLSELSALWPFALNASLYIFYYRMTAVMIEQFGSKSDVADFRVAFVVVLAALYLPKAISWASSPRLALYDEQGDKERFRRLLRQSADINLLIAGFVTLGGALYGARLIGIAFGHKYASLSTLWMLMNITIGIFYIQQFCVDLLNYLKKEREVVRTFVLGIVVLVALNFILIPRLGSVGAAWARLIAGCIMMPINLYTLASLIGFENLHGMNLYRFAAVNLIAGIIGFLLLQVNFWLSLVVFIAAYGALLLLLKVLPENIRKSAGRFMRPFAGGA